MRASIRLLTVNYDPGLLALRGVDAGDVAAVAAGVGDVDPVDGQDASSLCGLGQNFSVGLQVHQAVFLVGRKRCESQIFMHKRWAAKHIAATYQFAGVGPLDVHSCVKLNQCGAVQGEGLPHYQLYRVFRKQLDIVNLTSCAGKRKGGRKRQWDSGREAAKEVTATRSALFPSSQYQRK